MQRERTALKLMQQLLVDYRDAWAVVAHADHQPIAETARGDLEELIGTPARHHAVDFFRDALKQVVNGTASNYTGTAGWMSEPVVARDWTYPPAAVAIVAPDELLPAANALAKYPVVNASVDGTDVIYHGFADISIAVSTEKGLVTPVLRNVENMSFSYPDKAGFIARIRYGN